MSRFEALTPSGQTVSFPDDAPLVELDVREDLRVGREPFSKIMKVVEALRPEEVFLLHATFAPVPLISLLAERGFVYHLESQTDDDWCVWFWLPR